MKQYYIQAPPQPFQPIVKLNGNPVPKLHPSTIPMDYRKDRKEKIRKFFYEIEWQIKLIRGDFNYDNQNL